MFSCDEVLMNTWPESGKIGNTLIWYSDMIKLTLWCWIAGRPSDHP